VSGAVLVESLREIGAEIVEKTIVSDDFDSLVEVLKTQSGREDVNLIVTTGGTGFAPRDTTPEATRAVIEREAPGLAEAMRFESLKKTPTAMLSRATCGIRGNCLIVNLPGSPKAVRECFDVIKSVLPHSVALLAGHTEH
jgi:molybdenum cofactor synthesis domain-containing protein